MYQLSGYVTSDATAGAPTLNNHAKLYELGGAALFETGSLNQTIAQAGHFSPGITYELFGYTDLNAITSGIDAQAGDGSYYLALSLLSVPKPAETGATLGAGLLGFAAFRWMRRR